MELDTALAVADGTLAPDMELVALAPSDLLAAQTNLINWCDAKMKAVRSELTDLRENLQIAKASKWRTTSLQAAVARTAKRITFYEKIKQAITAGYLVVPNFPIDVFAVRVSRARPTRVVASYEHSSKLNAKPDLLPAGEGRYVDDRNFHQDQSYDEKKPDGSNRHVSRYVACGFDEDIDFPVQAVKPIVLDATHRAMALKIFDQMGVVRNQSGRDPIVVGQLLDPRVNGRAVTFFVAWWLNTSDL